MIRVSRLLPALALALLVAAGVAGCAQSDSANPLASSGSSVPDPTGGIDYHSGFYRMQNGAGP
jgi:hypothetical protein